MRRILPPLCAVLLVLAALAAGSAGAPVAAPAQNDGQAQALPPGAEHCIDCHPGVVAEYARTGMARALGPLVPGELTGLGAVEAGESGFSYHFEESKPDEDGATEAWLVETWTPPNGDASKAVRDSARVAFAIGAGVLDRSFAVEKHGMTWFAPLEVLSDGVGGPRRAELAPGHMVMPELRFDSPITEECLACHTDQLPPREYPLNLLPRGRRGWQPRGISCGACHGDVLRHARWRERELSGERPAGRDPVLSSSTMSLVERLSVCARCHLQGDARIALTPGERGVPPPGGDFLDRWAVFVSEQSDDEIGFVSQVERMTASPCFVRAQARPGPKMSCETCHDPHRSLHDPRERRRVRAGCLACHERFESSSKGLACSMPRARRADYDCVGCHMRTTEVFDLAHVRINDHKIERRLPPSDHYDEVRIKHTRDGKLRAFGWPGMTPPGYARDAGLKMMAAMIAGFPRVAVAQLGGLSSPEVRRLPTYNHLRGILLEQLVRDGEAQAAYEEALRVDPDSHDTKINLALLLGRQDRADEGLAMLDALLESYPRAVSALRNRALLRYQTGNAEGFSADLEAALAMLPRGPVARALADWYAKRGVRNLAEHWRTEARRLEPHVPVKR